MKTAWFDLLLENLSPTLNEEGEDFVAKAFLLNGFYLSWINKKERLGVTLQYPELLASYRTTLETWIQGEIEGDGGFLEDFFEVQCNVKDRIRFDASNILGAFCQKYRLACFDTCVDVENDEVFISSNGEPQTFDCEVEQALKQSAMSGFISMYGSQVEGYLIECSWLAELENMGLLSREDIREEIPIFIWNDYSNNAFRVGDSYYLYANLGSAESGAIHEGYIYPGLIEQIPIYYQVYQEALAEGMGNVA